MCLRTSRKVFESEIHARLIGRTLGIVYWVTNVIYLMKESLVIVEYYFGYLLSQNASTTRQIHVVETPQLFGSCSYNHFLCLGKCSVTVQNLLSGEKLANTSYLCTLPRQKMAKDKVESGCPCWHCLAKTHVKECPPAKPALQMVKVKVIFLNLEKNKNKDKNKTNATKE